MPFSPPALDDRGRDELLADMLARIPGSTPEWHHVRVGDPGRTLLELFAWMGEALLYRANLIPERQRLAFLRLLGLEPRPAQPARGLVCLALDDKAAMTSVRVPAGVEIKGSARFETRKQAWVHPVQAECYIKRPLQPGERSRLGTLLDDLPGVYGLAQERSRAVYYVTTPVFVGGTANPDGQPLTRRADDGTIDGCLWFALFAPDPAAARVALAPNRDGEHARVTVGLAPRLTLADPLDVDSAADSPKSTRVAMTWEITTGNETSDVMYARVDVDDGTAGLTRTGVVTLTLPAAIGAPINDPRQRLDAGTRDRPPRLDSDERAEQLVAWLRLRIDAPPGDPPIATSLSWAGFGAVEIDQRKTVFARVLGESTGLADQELSLGATSVEPETLRIEVAEPGADYEEWRPIADLALAGRDEPVYALRAEAGVIAFGDGVRGKVPPEFARVRAARMRSGGGEAGNLPPHSLKEARAADRSLKVSQGLATSGGRDAEPLAEAEKRIPAILRHRERAVTTDDFRSLAAHAPGTRVARVEVLPHFLPKTRVSGIPGVVSVMVLPPKLGALPPCPRADRVLLERVHAHLAPRRPLATELYVIGCEYVPLSVSVAVTPAAGLDPIDVAAAVRTAVRAHLWPLAPGGPDQTGFPLGGTVRARELEVVAARVSGVVGVATPHLFTRMGDIWKLVAPPHACGPAEIGLLPWQLPELLEVVVVTSGDTSPTALTDARDHDTAAQDFAIPVVPEVC